MLQIVNAIPLTFLNPKFAHPFSDRFHIARIAKRETPQTHKDFCLRPVIAQTGEPARYVVEKPNLHRPLL